MVTSDNDKFGKVNRSSVRFGELQVGKLQVGLKYVKVVLFQRTTLGERITHSHAQYEKLLKLSIKMTSRDFFARNHLRKLFDNYQRLFSSTLFHRAAWSGAKHSSLHPARSNVGNRDAVVASRLPTPVWAGAT